MHIIPGATWVDQAQWQIDQQFEIYCKPNNFVLITAPELNDKAIAQLERPIQPISFSIFSIY